MQGWDSPLGIGIFFIGLGGFFAGLGVLWWGVQHLQRKS